MNINWSFCIVSPTSLLNTPTHHSPPPLHHSCELHLTALRTAHQLCKLSYLSRFFWMARRMPRSFDVVAWWRCGVVLLWCDGDVVSCCGVMVLWCGVFVQCCGVIVMVWWGWCCGHSVVVWWCCVVVVVVWWWCGVVVWWSCGVVLWWRCCVAVLVLWFLYCGIGAMVFDIVVLVLRSGGCGVLVLWFWLWYTINIFAPHVH